MIKKSSTMEAWTSAIRYTLQEGEDFVDKDGRVCREVKNIKIEIANPEGDITVPIEKISASKEWVYPRIDDIANITLTRKYSPGHIYIYGQRIFSFDQTINQLDNFVIPLLRKDETTRRGVVSLWNPKIDANIFNKEVPSLMTFCFTINGDSLEVSVVIRSNNLFFGFPSNIYQIHLLQEYVAQRLDKVLGKITIFIFSAHIFDDQFDNAREMI